MTRDDYNRRRRARRLPASTEGVQGSPSERMRFAKEMTLNPRFISPILVVTLGFMIYLVSQGSLAAVENVRQAIDASQTHRIASGMVASIYWSLACIALVCMIMVLVLGYFATRMLLTVRKHNVKG